jgi:hypothetical protein
MAVNGDTGQGWTFTFGTQSVTLLVTQITCGKWSVSALDVSVLATTDFMEKLASDLKDAGTFTVDFLFKTSTTAPTVGTAPETLTITAAQMTGDTAAATLVGTGFVMDLTWPTAALGAVNKGQITCCWNGDTGPTYTKATV